MPLVRNPKQGGYVVSLIPGGVYVATVQDEKHYFINGDAFFDKDVFTVLKGPLWKILYP